MIIISNCDPSQSSKLYGEKGFLNPGRLENLEGEFKIVLMFSGGFNSFMYHLVIFFFPKDRVHFEAHSYQKNFPFALHNLSCLPT